MTGTLPSTLHYSPKHNAVNSQMQTQIHFPLSGSVVNPNDTIQIPLSTGKFGQYLDPSQIFLSFTIQNTDATNAFTLDHSAYSFFDRVQVQSSGETLSDLQFYAPWAAMILDGVSQSAKSSGFSVVAGSATNDNLNVVRTGASIAGGASLNVSLPLIGTAIDATGCDKLIPTGAMGDLSLVFYMSSFLNAIYTAGTAPTTAWRLNNFRAIATYVNVDENAQRMIDSETGGVFRWSSTLWRGYNFTTAATASADSIIVPWKGSSAKSLFSMWRLASGNENAARMFQSARQNPFSSLLSTQTGLASSSFFASIGSASVPQVPLRNVSEHFASMQNAWHALSVGAAYDTNFRATDYDINSATSVAGSFLTGINLESFTGKSGTAHSGMSVLGGTALILNAIYAGAFGSTNQPAAACLVNTYMNFDAIIEIDQGQVRANF